MKIDDRRNVRITPCTAVAPEFRTEPLNHQLQGCGIEDGADTNILYIHPSIPRPHACNSESNQTTRLTDIVGFPFIQNESTLPTKSPLALFGNGAYFR